MMKAGRFSYVAAALLLAFGATHIARARLNFALARCLRQTAGCAFPCALSIDPTDDRATYHLGLNALRGGRPAEAVRDFSRSLDSRPDNELAAYFLGTSDRQVGNEESAVAIWRRYGLGKAFHNRAWHNGNLDDFQTAIAIGNVDAATLFKFGDLLFEQGQAQRAAAAYQRGLAMSGYGPDALLVRARLAEIAGDLPQSLAISQRVLTMRPDDADIYCRVAGLYVRMHEPARAIEWSTRASNRFPKEPSVFITLGRSFEAAKKFGDADRAYARAAELQPSNFWIPYDRGRIALETGDRDRAQMYFRHSITLNPTSPYIYVDLGRTLQSSGRTDEACSAFRSALRLQPHNADALAGVGALSCH